ncbi:DUF2510 domain-containing protein [Pseudarthrobacter sp. SSS035]|uniref:DUF2510 domain-containing protein n=1 Tax=Pseudarthrobacter sp. SSS035 TaxID=2931399 RepID=UPI002010095E|nr:DUF2510 domain-containing protein [Pseudarthrobacter sp. SSS035]
MDIIMEGAADELKFRLEGVGVPRAIAFSISQVAYVEPKALPHWVPHPIVGEKEVRWLVRKFEPELQRVTGSQAKSAQVMLLCVKIFGPIGGEVVFASGYPGAPTSARGHQAHPSSLNGGQPLHESERPLMNNPSAGWYKDTDNPSQQRWWDGKTWTQHTQAIGGLSNTIDAAAGTSGTVGPSNPAATTGFSLGIAAFFLFNTPIFGLLLSLAAAVVSGIGLSKQSSAMAKKFRVFGIVGLILGIVYTLMALLALSGAL